MLGLRFVDASLFNDDGLVPVGGGADLEAVLHLWRCPHKSEQSAHQVQVTSARGVHQRTLPGVVSHTDQ